MLNGDFSLTSHAHIICHTDASAVVYNFEIQLDVTLSEDFHEMQIKIFETKCNRQATEANLYLISFFQTL